MKSMFMAEDGTLFDDEGECQSYEAVTLAGASLQESLRTFLGDLVREDGSLYIEDLAHSLTGPGKAERFAVDVLGLVESEDDTPPELLQRDMGAWSPTPPVDTASPAIPFNQVGDQQPSQGFPAGQIGGPVPQQGPPPPAW